MSTVISSISICPLNFNEFSSLNLKLKNLDASILYAKLKFHEINSTIKKGGKTCIARSRDQIASWFGFGVKKIDRLLSFLEEEGMIEKQVGLWYGKKRLFISTSNQF